MIDISSAKITKLIVHRIGNKLRDEGFVLSQKESERTSALDELLLANYLKPVITKGDAYDLHHESDLALNVVHHFANLTFSNQKSFKTNSQSIARHLYSASTHPNIGGGEFIEILFDDIRTDSGAKQGLGLFRIEGKNDFLDVVEFDDSLRIVERTGISLDKIQKGAVILSESTQVFVIDALGQKTKYWLESFLKVVRSGTPKACAKAVGALLKAISNKVESPSNALEFGRRIQESLSDSEFLSIGFIRNISNTYLHEEEVNGIFDGIRSKVGLQFNDELEVDSRQLTRYTKDVVTKARIAEGINLVFSKNIAHVASLEVKPTKNGIRAIVDIDIKRK